METAAGVSNLQGGCGPVSSLFVMHVGTNTGYAIEPLERMFYRAGLDLGRGNPGRVHFAYPDFEKGKPKCLPDDFSNLLEFDFRRADREKILEFAKYVRQHGIDLVIFFDIQLFHPIFKHLRRAGVRSIISYWGGPDIIDPACLETCNKEATDNDLGVEA